MKAFHNDPKIKEKYLLRVKQHQLADEIVKGKYWWREDDGIFRGCAVGCTLHSSDHEAYEYELGIPIILARLEDGIFENLPENRCKMWPYEFLDSINIGADLSNVWPKFAVWLLTDDTHGVLQYAKSDEAKKYIIKVAGYYSNYKEITKKQWKDVAAAYAAYAAAYAAAAAADAAYAVAAADAAADAAVAAYAADADDAAVAAYAADAAAYAADADDADDDDADDDAAAYAADDAAAYAADAYAAYAADYAREKHRIAQADKLLELLRQTK